MGWGPRRFYLSEGRWVVRSLWAVNISLGRRTAQRPLCWHRVKSRPISMRMRESQVSQPVGPEGKPLAVFVKDVISAADLQAEDGV